VKGWVDETGESITAFIPSPKGRNRKARQKQVSMVDVGVMRRLKLSVYEATVFWNIVSHVPPRSGSVSYVTVKKIAEEEGIHRVNVSKTLKSLRDRRIIRTIARGQHHVNTHIAFSGSFDDWNAADGTEAEPIWERHGVDPVTGVIL
jgi:hypothetical protein